MATFEQTYGTREQRLAEVERMRRHHAAAKEAGRIKTYVINHPKDKSPEELERYQNELKAALAPIGLWLEDKE